MKKQWKPVGRLEKRWRHKDGGWSHGCYEEKTERKVTDMGGDCWNCTVACIFLLKKGQKSVRLEATEGSRLTEFPETALLYKKRSPVF